MADVNNDFQGRVNGFKEGLAALVKEYDVDVVATISAEQYGIFPQVKLVDVKGIPEQEPNLGTLPTPEEKPISAVEAIAQAQADENA